MFHLSHWLLSILLAALLFLVAFITWMLYLTR